MEELRKSGDDKRHAADPRALTFAGVPGFSDDDAGRPRDARGFRAAPALPETDAGGASFLQNPAMDAPYPMPHGTRQQDEQPPEPGPSAGGTDPGARPPDGFDLFRVQACPFYHVGDRCSRVAGRLGACCGMCESGFSAIKDIIGILR